MATTGSQVRARAAGLAMTGSRAALIVSGALIVLSVVGGGAARAQERLNPPSEGPELVPPRVERAIELGIEWLLSVRSADGVWRNQFSPRRGRYPCANTALVGLTLLANGSTATRGPHGPVVSEISDYLLRCSQSNGLFTDPSTREIRPMYSHAFSLTFLATLLGQEGRVDRRRRIESALGKGIVLLGRAQTSDGGWGYTPNEYEDEGTLVVTELTGLRMCRDAGIPVPRQLVDDAVRYIVASSRSDGRVMYRARSNDYRPGVTCASVVALWHAGLYESQNMAQTRRYVNTRIAPYTGTHWERTHHGEYVEYYLAQAMWIQGGPAWEQHYRRISDHLVSAQLRDGSWSGQDSRDYGTIYSTAIALLILELPYQRLTAFQR